jgi:nitroreductase
MTDPALYEHLLQVATMRRTNRQFKPDPIPEGYIEKIIEVARWAPSGFHTQPWEFVAITERDVRNRIVAALEKNSPPITDPNATDTPRPSFRDAPAFIFALCDWRAYVGLPGNLAQDNPRVADIFCSSMAGTFLLMHLAAASLGLASQWYSAAGSPKTEPVIRDIIGMPDALKIYDLMVLGYPAAPPVPKEVRKVDQMLHYDDCGADDFRTDAQVQAEAAKTKAWCLSAH